MSTTLDVDPDKVRLPSALSPRSWFGRGLAGVGVLAVLATLGRFAVPVAAGQTIDSVSAATGPDISVIAAAGIALVVAAACTMVLNLRVGERTEEVLDTARRVAFLRLAAPSVPPERASRRAAWMLDDADGTSEYARWTGPKLWLHAVTAVGGVAAMLWYSWLMTMGSLPLLMGLVVAGLRRRIGFVEQYGAERRLDQQLRTALRDTMVQSGEAWPHAAQRRVAIQTEALAAERDRHRIRVAAAEGTVQAMFELSLGLAVAASAAIGMVLVGAGHLTVGQFAGFVLVVLLVVAPSLPVLTWAVPAQWLAYTRWRRLIRTSFRSRP